MKKILFLWMLGTSLCAMVRASVNVPPPAETPYSDGAYNQWYGPGLYYGIYFTDYPTYYAWQREHYYGGPYYWRHSHNYRNSYHNNGHHGGRGHR